MFDLKGRTAIVTGAGRGVGAEIARHLARRGAIVAVNDVVDERAEEIAAEILADGGTAIAAVFDVTDHGAVATAAAALEREVGGVDILINNAGVPAQMRVAKFVDSLPEDWRKYIELNLYGVMNCCRAIVPGMCKRGWGRVITISSGAGTVGLNFGVSPYAAGKGGAISFMRHLALETAASGVTANTVAIGLIDNQADPSVTASLAKTIPVGRLGRPDDVAALCLYLASSEAAWMTGQTIGLNGGSPTS